MTIVAVLQRTGEWVAFFEGTSNNVCGIGDTRDAASLQLLMKERDIRIKELMPAYEQE